MVAYMMLAVLAVIGFLCIAGSLPTHNPKR